MMPRALIFDVDGTLADTEEAHRRAFNGAFAEHGLPWQWSPEEYVVLLHTTGGKERIRTYIDSLALDPREHAVWTAAVGALHETKTRLYTQLIRDGAVPLREGVARLLDEAPAAGIRLAIATTTHVSNVEALLLTHLGARALERFAVIGAGDVVPRKKPAPDIYELVLRELGERAGDCMAFEDSAHGLAAAQGAGLFTVVTPTYWTKGEDLSAADLLLPSLQHFRLDHAALPARESS